MMTNDEYDKNVTENLKKKWYVQECSIQGDCWCLIITTNLDTHEMEDCIAASGCVPREYAKHVVRLHNEELVALESQRRMP